jgi:hypothetical protein
MKVRSVQTGLRSFLRNPVVDKLSRVRAVQMPRVTRHLI